MLMVTLTIVYSTVYAQPHGSRPYFENGTFFSCAIDPCTQRIGGNAGM